MEMKPFWMVLADNSAHTSYRHDTKDRAIAEAKRLSAMNRGTKFYVLCAFGCALVQEPVEYTEIESDQIPF